VNGTTLLNAAAARLGRVPAVALLVAAVWAALLLVAAFRAPVYESASGSSSGAPTPGTDTLVGVNGLGAAVVVAVPLLVTLAVGLVLWLGARRPRVPVAWTLTGLLAALTVLALPSVGLFFLPVVGALVAACATRRPLAPAPR